MNNLLIIFMFTIFELIVLSICTVKLLWRKENEIYYTNEAQKWLYEHQGNSIDYDD